MGNKRKSLPGIYLDPDIINGKAFRSLQLMPSYRVLVRFYQKRVFTTTKIGKKKKKVLVNNGRIVFTYSEAIDLNISKQQFLRARDELVEKGFIDIVHAGGGMEGDCSRYKISERYLKFGQPDFEYAERKKDTRGSKIESGRKMANAVKRLRQIQSGVTTTLSGASNAILRRKKKPKKQK